jgi:hypothetical protein
MWNISFSWIYIVIWSAERRNGNMIQKWTHCEGTYRGWDTIFVRYSKFQMGNHNVLLLSAM